MSARWIAIDELANVIGTTEARALCRAYGGLARYVPAKPNFDHPYVKVIGARAFEELCAYAGGWHLELPNLRRKPAKGRILSMLEQGKSHETIADVCKVSVRYVRYLAAESRPSERQLELPL